MRFILYYHKSKFLTNYVIQFSVLKNLSTEILSLPQQNAHSAFATLPASVRRLLFFAKPDLVLCFDNGREPIRPIFALEISEHVPARDHWMQRFPNLVGCAQEGVPGAYIMPFSMTEREGFKGTEDPVFFFAYDRVMEIHQTPIYIAEWESPDNKTLRGDKLFANMPDHTSKSMHDVFAFLNLVMELAIHSRKFDDLMRDRLFVELRNKIRQRAYKIIPKISEFERLTYNMPKGNFLTFEEFKDWIKNRGLRLPANLPDRIVKRQKNLIFAPQSNPRNKSDNDLRDALIKRISLKGGDPYTGFPLAFDYIFCRLGPTTYERDCNLIIDLSVLKFSDIAKYHREIWKKSPMQYTEMKDIENDITRYTMSLREGDAQVVKNFVRIYAFAADIIIFKDGIIYF